MFEIKILGHIAAAHFLRGYEGKCKDLHGHTWKVEVTMKREQLDSIGMVVDFAVLKKQLKQFLDVLDHKCLNDLDYFKEVNPTTENIAKFIFENFAREVEPIVISQVQVWESDTASIIYYA